MEALIPLAFIVALALLAYRFGYDSRPGLPSAEDRFSRIGMIWNKTSKTSAAAWPPPSAPAALDGPVIKQLVWAQARGGEEIGTQSSYPTLEAIDLARTSGSPAFASDPAAERLERRARDLTGRYWSELVWLTGLVDQSRFEAVCAELERERQSPAVQVIVMPEASPIAS